MRERLTTCVPTTAVVVTRACRMKLEEPPAGIEVDEMQKVSVLELRVHDQSVPFVPKGA